MPDFIPYLIFPIAIVMYLGKGKPRQEEFLFYLSVLVFKIAAACGMTYLLLTRYETGDFELYFVVAREVSEELLAGRMEFHTLWSERGGYLVANLNALIFIVFPASLYGITIVAGCTSFVYSVVIIQATERHFEMSKWVKWLVLFAPALSMQSGYVGKETYVLPTVALIVYWLSQDRSTARYTKSILTSLAVSAIRVYQTFLMVLPLVLSWTVERRMWLRSPAGLAALAAGVLLAVEIFTEATFEAGYGELGEFLSSVYAGGRLTLPAYPFPFSILQNFRPFPWEAHNELALAASMETLLFLGCFLWLCWKRARESASQWTPAQRRLAGFFFGTAIGYMAVFQFNENLGDMSRRHAYYYPFLLLMLSRPLQGAPKPNGNSRLQSV